MGSGKVKLIGGGDVRFSDDPSALVLLLKGLEIGFSALDVEEEGDGGSGFVLASELVLVSALDSVVRQRR